MSERNQVAQHHSLRVCHFASGDLWAGAEVQVAMLLGALTQIPDLELSALLLNRGRLFDELTLRGIPVTVCDESRHGVGRLLGAVTSYLREFRPNIVHSHRYKEHILGAFAGKLSHTPIVVRTYHGLEESLSGWAGFKMKLYNGIDTVVGKMTADGVIGVSSEITGILERRFPASDVRCIRNGIELTRVAPTVDRRVMRAQLGLSHDSFVVGTVGRLMPIKGLEYLIEAFQLFQHAYGPHKSELVIVGDGPLKASLMQCAEVHGVAQDVHLLGARTDVYNVMSVFDVFALPSLHEGVPMVLLEAMAMEIPIVASRVGGIPEILEDDKEALHVSPKDPAALARKIALCATTPDLRARLGRAARARVACQFTIKASAASMHGMYRSLIGQGDH